MKLKEIYIYLKSHQVSVTIREAAHRLLDEASRYDEILRNRRVSEVRQYFDDKRRSHKFAGEEK